MDFMCLSNAGIYGAFNPLYSQSSRAGDEAINGTFDYDYRLFAVITNDTTDWTGLC